MTFKRHGVPPASGAAGATGLAYQSTGSAEDDERLPQSSVDHVAPDRCVTAHRAYERMEVTRYEARARYSSMASAGTWAMPSTITYLILRSRMRTRSSRVDIPSRRAASLARRGSADISPSLGVVEAQFTAKDPDLRFDAHHLGQVAAVNEAVPASSSAASRVSASSRL